MSLPGFKDQVNPSAEEAGNSSIIPQNHHPRVVPRDANADPRCQVLQPVDPPAQQWSKSAGKNQRRDGSSGPDYKHQVQSVVRQAQQQQQQQQQPGAFHVSPSAPMQQTRNHRSYRDQPRQIHQSSEYPGENQEVPALQRANVGPDDALLADVVPECKCFCRCERYKVLWALSILATFLVALAVFLAVFCGTGNCGKGSSSAAADDEASVPAPTVTADRDPTVAAAVARYINNITLSGTDIVYPVTNGSPTKEEMALQWLIEDDPLQLTTDTEADQFRLGQRYALATLYFYSNGQAWTDSTGWLLDSDECRWFGISCDWDSSWGTVSKVDLRFNELHGPIPEDVALLTSLTVLDLQSNSIGGTIPESILHLTLLTALNLSTNSIAGTIPDAIGVNLSSLTYLDVGGNKLSGTLPDSIRNLIGLQLFSVWDNKLIGPLFEVIGQLPNLGTVWAGGNAFNGTLNDSIGQWTGMTEFALNNNAFSGKIPESIGEWVMLTDFRINDNAFSGTLPNSIGRWSKLTRFWVQNNAFEKKIPESIGNWSQVKEASFSDNAFTGTMPTEMCSVSSLETLDVDCAEVQCSCCKKDGVKICD